MAPRRHTHRRPSLRAYAVCAPGLAPLVAAELDGLGIRPGRQDRGGVAFRATTRQLYAANAWLRCATRVLVRLGAFPARNFAELERGAASIDWAPVAVPGAPLRLRVTATASQLYHTDAVAQRLADALGTSLVAPADDPGFEVPLLVVRVNRDKVTISADSSGLPLYRRGWHVAAGPAPLRETLAAAMLAAVGWDGTSALLDPLCGAGTIPIEAARLAAGRPPSLPRDFAFQRWASFEPGTWASVTAELTAAETAAPTTTAAIVGRDHDPGAVAAAAANAEAAGVADLVELVTGTVASTDAPVGTGWLLTNPPYGKRVDGGADLRNLYAAVGNLARRRLPGWSVGVLAADAALVRHTGLALEPRFHTTNGGLDVSLWAPSPDPQE